MTILTASDRLVNLDDLTYGELCEMEHKAECNIFPSNHTAEDAAWLASLNDEPHTDEPTPVEALDEPASDPADWPAWTDEDIWEDGPAMTDADWDSLCEERWGTVFPVF